MRNTTSSRVNHWVCGLLLAASAQPARATFSIVAVDSITGEVGGAGASCLEGGAQQGVLVISDVLPGKGSLHTQAYHDMTNKQHAREQLLAGNPPQAVVDWLSKNDVAGNPEIRQYGVADLYQGKPRAAAFTGKNCQDYKGHRVGPNYALQGNILKGAGILDSMQARFLRTPGTLADKLMAAMQGAKVRGADTRCLAESVSTQSAFLRVARPTDTQAKLYLDLRVPSRPRGKEPIDSLQMLYTKWKSTVAAEGRNAEGAPALRFSRLPGLVRVESRLFPANRQVLLAIYSLSGKKLFASALPAQGMATLFSIPLSLRAGLYVFQIDAGGERMRQKAFWY